jgi:hypothetical protein
MSLIRPIPITVLTGESLYGTIGPIPRSTFNKSIEDIRILILDQSTSPEEKWISVLRLLDQTLRAGGLALHVAFSA